MSIQDPERLEQLIHRLRELRPESERQWGTMTPGEMLCHLTDGHDHVLMRRPLPDPEKPKTRRLLKWIALNTPFPWAKGAKTHPSADPKQDGTQPTDFDADRERVIEGLQKIAAAGNGELAPTHGLFGPMSTHDWQRSVSRHVDHHLRQFGV